MEKKGLICQNDNSSGVVSVVMGIQSIVFALLSPVAGLIFGVIGLFFANNQAKKKIPGCWARKGKIVSIVGIIISIAIWIITITLLAPFIESFMASQAAIAASG